MKETGIIMSGNHPKLILDGLKTQTRRVIKPQPPTTAEPCTCKGVKHFYLRKVPPPINKTEATCDVMTVKCPYGQVGDRLGVRETHYKFGKWTPSEGEAGWTFKAMTTEVRYCDNPPDKVLSNKQRLIVGWFKRPSMFMFKRDSRTWSEITEVRAERVQEITEEDAKVEGLIADPLPTTKACLCDSMGRRHICKFIDLWDSLNAKRGYGWEANLWVWVISFKIDEEKSCYS